MIYSTPSHDVRLRESLAALSAHDPDYWSFEGQADRKNGHGLFHYPAMMVPQVARAILTEACTVHPEIKTVGDPFVGSGTVLTEVLARGLDFVGTDINPLAILLCRVKAGPFNVDSLREKARLVNRCIEEDAFRSVDVRFTSRDKWFTATTQISLSRIRRAILNEQSRWARCFFWIALAEAARLSSNSRTSTVKLHTRPVAEITRRQCDPVALFRKAILRNLKYFETQAHQLIESNALTDGRYKGNVDIILGDTRHVDSRKKVDMILTSPPYGDNVTTVTYGQYSYLPLQWVELADIDPTADLTYLKSTHEIDSRSLGGSRRVRQADHSELIEKSPALKDCLSHLMKMPPDRASRVLAFFRDVDSCLPGILKSLHPGGLMVWALGNRSVGNRRVPFDRILAELLADRGVTVLCEFSRRIPSKRMASKNSIADTMTREAILVMRKAAI